MGRGRRRGSLYSLFPLPIVPRAFSFSISPAFPHATSSPGLFWGKSPGDEVVPHVQHKEVSAEEREVEALVTNRSWMNSFLIRVWVENEKASRSRNVSDNWSQPPSFIGFAIRLGVMNTVMNILRVSNSAIMAINCNIVTACVYVVHPFPDLFIRMLFFQSMLNIIFLFFLPILG